MKAIYYLFIIGVDAFAHGAADPVGVINKGLPADMTSQDLIYNYYKVLFMRMHRMTSVQDYSDYSINYSRLSLNTPEEAAILFYQSMSYFGARYSRLGRSDCNKAKVFANNMPLYEGKKFYEYKLPYYKSFDIYYGQMISKKPIMEAIGAPYQKAIDTYHNCK
jgi:hypothetical protein